MCVFTFEGILAVQNTGYMVYASLIRSSLKPLDWSVGCGRCSWFSEDAMLKNQEVVAAAIEGVC